MTFRTSLLQKLAGLRRHSASRLRKARSRRFYSQFIHPGELCFDIGANLGNRLETFVGLGAAVVALEPQESCIEELQHRFGRKPGIRIIKQAVWKNAGSISFYPSGAATVSSASTDWTAAVKASGRFAAIEWQEAQTVEATTLDLLIETFGLPVFCKIDVEGSELEVLQGLSQPIKALSYEFTSPEFRDRVLECASRLASLGPYEFNLSLGESLRLQNKEWGSIEAVAESLQSFGQEKIFGDIYARLWKTE